MGNDKKKQAKARRDAIAEKLKQISSSTIVHTKQEKLQEDAKLQSKEEIEAKFVPIAEDDVVSQKVDQQVAVVVSRKKNENINSSNKDSSSPSQAAQQKQQKKNDDDDDDDDSDDDHNQPSIKSLIATSVSNRQRKQQERPPVSYLKSLLYHSSAPKLPGVAASDNNNRDDLVDLADVTATDPEFLMLLKDARNTIPVPIHWRQKSKFMSHTVDRDANSAFEATVMPNWIVNMQLEQAWKPGVRAMESFRLENLFKPFVAGHPTPELSTYGDLFYEGKDMRARLRGFRPGQLSQRLRSALEMGSSSTMPPPWLSGMQKVARLPPSYPNIKIPGLNSPIPDGASYGRGRNQWGEPPRDPANNNKFLFEGVDRSSASVKNSEEAQFALASCWGSAGSMKKAGNNNANTSRNTYSSSDYACIFTAPKAEIEAARFRKQQQELREQELQQQREQEMMYQQQQQQAQQQAQQYQYGGQQQQRPNVVIPQHMLQAAGVTGYQQQQQPYYGGQQQQPPQQFGVEVNTSQNLPGMGLVNYNNNNPNQNNQQQQQQYR